MMKISFQMILFNAISTLPENMLNLNIENILPFAHEILIIEGATKALNGHYFDGDTTEFTKNGRSTDGTIDVILALQEKYPDKIKVVIGDGYWNGKTTMCNTAAKIATGDYTWAIDQDEFYHQSDMEKIIKLLEDERPNRVDFWANHFFGGFDYCIDEREAGWGNNPPWMRIFKHTPNYSYWISHEPPVYRGCSTGHIIDRNRTLGMGIKLFHYGYVHYPQIAFKTKFYKNNQYPILWDMFQKDKSTKIFGSNVYKFTGDHPECIKGEYGL